MLKPTARKGKQPVPAIIWQHILKTRERAKMFQTNGIIALAKDKRIFLDIEPSKRVGVETALHIGATSFEIVGPNDGKPRIDIYIALSDLDEFIIEYLIWRLKNGKGINR